MDNIVLYYFVVIQMIAAMKAATAIITFVELTVFTFDKFDDGI